MTQKSCSSRSSSKDYLSRSSLSSLTSQSPKKKKKNDRMIYSIDKTHYQWSQKISRKSVKKTEYQASKYNQKDFEDYLTDNLSDDSQSFKQFYQKNLLKKKQYAEKIRKVSDVPFKKTTFRNWKDNFYTNLLDWNFQKIIFAADQQQIFQYHLSNFNSRQAIHHQDIYIKGSRICSIKCSPTQKNIAIAYDCGTLRIYNYQCQKTLMLNCLHVVRLTALDWTERTILTGSKDRKIEMLDQRTFKQSFNFQQVHKQQVLGIKRMGNLIATGGNDNLVVIYDIRKSSKALHTYEHEAAIKSLAWIQDHGILLSGGGTSDKKIKFWNSKQHKIVRQIETGSQVCNLIISKNTKQFVSCQGFSQNQIVLWNLQGKRVETLHGKHSARVLYSAISPCGQYLATGAGDSNLFVWKLFPPSTVRRNRLMADSFDLR